MDEKAAKNIIDQYNEMKLGADAFIEKTNLSNEAIGSYLHTVKSGDATFSGCTKHINEVNNSIGLMGIKAKATTVLMNGLKFAAGTFGMILLSKVINSAIEKIDTIIHKSEIIAENAEKALENIKKLNDEFNDKNDVVKDYSERYAELAQHVNPITNKNIDLSTEEYDEYLEINEKLLKVFPQLYKGINDNGNAFVSLNGDVSEIISTLNVLIEKERELTNIEILKSMPSVFEGVQNKVKEYKNQIDVLNEKKSRLTQTKTEATTDNHIPIVITGNGDAYIKKVIENSDLTTITNLQTALHNLGVEYKTTSLIIKENGIDIPYTKFDFDLDEDLETQLINQVQNQANTIADIFGEESYKIDKEILAYEQKIEKAYMDINPVADIWLQNNFRYSNLNEPLQEIVDTMVAGINFKSLKIDTEEKMDDYITSSILQPLFYASPEVEDSFAQLFDMQTKLKNNEITEEEFSLYITQMFDGLLSGMDDDVANKFKNAFINGFSKIGLEGNTFDVILQSLISSWTTQAKTLGNISFNFLSESYKKDIEEYKNELSSLANWQNEFLSQGFLSSGSLYDLESQFSDIFDFSEFELTGNYEQMFSQLKQALLDNLIDPLNEILQDTNIEPSVKMSVEIAIRMIKGMSQEAFNSISIFNAYSSALDEIQESYNTVKAAIEEYQDNQKLSLDTIQSLLSLDDKYIGILFNEQGQLTLNTETYTALTKAKLYDMYVSIAANALDTAKSITNEDEAKDFLKQTTIDLTNEKMKLVAVNLAEAQSEIDLAKAAGEDVTARQAALDSITETTNNKIKLIQEAMDSINLDANRFFKGSGSNEKNEIDWIAESIEHANKKIKELDNVLNNTKGFQNRLEVYEKLKEANQDLIDTTKKASNKYKDIWENKASKISSKYIQLITGDRSKFQIEQFYDEYTYNKIKEAMDTYDTWQESIEQYNNALEKQKEIQDNINSLCLERAEISLDILNLEDQESMTVSEKNKWLEKEKTIKSEILQYNLALAESDEERLKFEKEHAKYLEENAEVQYQNLRRERANRVDYFGTRIQDIQNEIELEEARGGQGTETQYKQMNKFLDKQIAVYQQDYEKALAKRNAATPRTDKWYQYNQEIQEAQDNIHNCTQAQIENNKAILLLPVKEYENLNEKLQEQLDLLNEYQSKVENAIGYASTLIQDQVDILNENKENISDYWDKQIESVQKQKDKLTESNDELKRQIDLENAKYNLEKAMRNKTSRVKCMPATIVM